MIVSDDGLYFGPCLNPGDSIVQGRMYDGGPYYPRQVVPRGGEPSVFAEPLGDEDMAAIREAFARKLGQPPKVLGLPWHVRLRLTWQQAVTGAGIWLCDHRMRRLAGWLWWRR